jgi:NAD-dependent SIR2 family protein deacetylase
MAASPRREEFQGEWERERDDTEVPAGSFAPRSEHVVPFYAYTSNIDRFHERSGLEEEQIHEIHGEIETWFCVECSAIETVPLEVRFDVDMATMLANELHNEVDRYEDRKFYNWKNNRPTCECGGQVRPNILMFGDNGWLGNRKKSRAYYHWRRAVEGLCEKKNWRLVIVELGCGTNVPTVRNNSETLLKDMPNSRLIRVNPDFPLTSSGRGLSLDDDQVVSILSGARGALEDIEKHLFAE